MAVLTVGTHPDRCDHAAWAGRPFERLIPVLDATGAVVDVSAWTVLTARINATLDGGPVLHTFVPTLSAAGITISATEEQTAAWAAAWPARMAPWELLATHPSGEPIFDLAGWVTLYP